MYAFLCNLQSSSTAAFVWRRLIFKEVGAKRQVRIEELPARQFAAARAEKYKLQGHFSCKSPPPPPRAIVLAGWRRFRAVTN